MGKKDRILLVAFVTTVVLAVVVRVASCRNEPSYHGKSLSDWVVEMRDGPDRKKAREALHQLGTNSLPMLLVWLQQEDHSTLKGSINNFRTEVDFWLVNHKLVKSHPTTSYFDAKASHRALGILAFEELGPEGKAAIPALIGMLGDKADKSDEPGETAGAAWCVLSKMSPESIGPLIQTLSSPDEQTRFLAASALGMIGTNASAAIPILERWLHDKNLRPRLVAARVLGEIGGDPREFIPVVTASLSGTNFETLDFQLEILVASKNEAKSAIPLLLQILTNNSGSTNPTNAAICNSVMNALNEIDPEAAIKAGVK